MPARLVLQMDGTRFGLGSVTQVRETAALFTRLAKQQGVVIILVGRITRRVVWLGQSYEHMIDCFMMLDSPAVAVIAPCVGTKIDSVR